MAIYKLWYVARSALRLFFFFSTLLSFVYFSFNCWVKMWRNVRQNSQCVYLPNKTPYAATSMISSNEPNATSLLLGTRLQYTIHVQNKYLLYSQETPHLNAFRSLVISTLTIGRLNSLHTLGCPFFGCYVCVVSFSAYIFLCKHFFFAWLFVYVICVYLCVYPVLRLLANFNNIISSVLLHYHLFFCRRISITRDMRTSVDPLWCHATFATKHKTLFCVSTFFKFITFPRPADI